MTQSVEVNPTVTDPAVVSAAWGVAVDVLVMPMRNVNGVAVYSQESLDLVKELRAAGLTAAFLHGPSERIFEAKKSAVAVLGAIALGIATNAGWDGVKALMRRGGPTGKLAVTFTDLKDQQTSAMSWTVTGDSDAVLDAIDKLRRSDDR